MKKWKFLSLALFLMPMLTMAQDDDMYFVPKKSKAVKTSSAYERVNDTYYSGSNRTVDDYNRRGSHYETVVEDSSDIISFDEIAGEYPDSTNEDYALTKKMSRWDDYLPSDAYYEGYADGRRDSWGWHSPWYYSSFYPWYDYSWYDPWYWGPSWHYSWYDSWYYRSWSWGWGGYYSSWYYRPWHYGWYGGVTHNWGRAHHGDYRSVVHGSSYTNRSSRDVYGSRRVSGTTSNNSNRAVASGQSRITTGSRRTATSSSTYTPSRSRSAVSSSAATSGSRRSASSSSSSVYNNRSSESYSSGSRLSSGGSRSGGSFGGGGSRSGGSIGGGGGSRGGSRR